MGIIVQSGGINAYTSGSGASTAVLEAQHANLQRQLADWECCSSAKTPEGKAKIKELSDRSRTVEARLAEVNASQQVRQPVSISAVNLPSPSDSTALRIPKTQGSAGYSANATLGNNVDVFV